MLETVFPVGNKTKNTENAVQMKNNINNLRYLQNYSKMHHLYDSAPSFPATMSKCPFLTALRCFLAFFVALLAFLELFTTRLLYDFKAPLPKKYPGKNVIHEILFRIHKIHH